MKIILPNRDKTYLPGNKTYEERLEIVDNILRDYKEYFESSWDTQKTKTCLDILANYLARAKDFKAGEHATLSVKKQAELDKGDPKCAPFSSLSKYQQGRLGLIDLPDDEE